MTVPRPARGARDQLDESLHRSDRHIGVITGWRERGLYLAILTDADDAESAQAKALRLVAAALDKLGLAELVPDIELGEVVGSRKLPGGPHIVDTGPAVHYRTTQLADGRVLHAAFDSSSEEWFAYAGEEPSRIMAGRILGEVLHELLELPWGKKDAWFCDAIEALAGHATAEGPRYRCPCCGYLTLDEAPRGTYAICGVCFWEEDGVQLRDPTYRGGANTVSLNEVRENFRQYGATEERLRAYVRPPRPAEEP